uniref:DUF4457 domain-containing protein n=1 Tax=Caenorhabditis japonica TaxID=281687 RepID=A0A8R1E966_CAEJA
MTKSDAEIEEIQDSAENLTIFSEQEEEEEEQDMDHITIPELPEGQILELRLLSNWGDNKFIGLNSVEIFTATGNRAEIQKVG